MTRMRRLSSALFLVPLSLLASHAARATAPVVPPGTVNPSTVTPLPYGIHRLASGRYTRDICDHRKQFHCFAQILLPRGWTPDQVIPSPQGSGSISGMLPSDIQTAYGLTSATVGQGGLVAIIDEPDNHAFVDANAYRAQFGITPFVKCSNPPVPSAAAPCFLQVSESGGASSGDAGESSDGETSLDMDMVSAACPACSLLLVDIPTLSDQDWIAAVATAANLGAVATSISAGGEEKASGSDDPTGYTTKGHLVLASSGDGAYDNQDESGWSPTPNYPSSAPDVVAVGGTALFALSSGYGEGVWLDPASGEWGAGGTTSGCSTEYLAPSWQSAVLGGICTNGKWRGTADLAAAATFFSGGEEQGIAVEESGGWSPVVGTSASSPMVAAILTRFGLAGAIADSIASGSNWIYDNAGAFNDVGSSGYPIPSGGSKTNAPGGGGACGKICNAGTGWDGPTGVGTPNGSALLTLSGGGSDAGPPGVDSGPPGVDSGYYSGPDGGPTGVDGGYYAGPDSGGGQSSGG